MTLLVPYSSWRQMTNTILQTEFLLQFWKQWENSAILLASNKPHNKDQTKKQIKTEGEKNKERLKTTEEILTLGFDYVTPILEIHLRNTMTWFMWGSNLFWWLNNRSFVLNQLGHLLCCWRCNLSITNFFLYMHLVVCLLGLSTWVGRATTRCVAFAFGPFHWWAHFLFHTTMQSCCDAQALLTGEWIVGLFFNVSSGLLCMPRLCAHKLSLT